LVPIDKVPCLRAEYDQRNAARQLAHEEPWTEAILRVLETDDYRSRDVHVPGSIAQVLGMSEAIERRCLDKLEAAGVIARRGDRYQTARSLTVDTRAIPQLKAHWCEVARQRVGDPAPSDVFSYNVLSASRADVERIRHLLIATYREIRTIVEHTERDEAVALVNLQLVTWNGCETMEPMTPRIDTASRWIAASPASVYRAFKEPGAMERWLPPGNMTGKMLHFDFREGGAYRMRLIYAEPQQGLGKTSEDYDEVEVRLTKLEDGRSIEQEINLESEDPAFSGVMRMTWTFQPEEEGTLVTIRAENVPAGIRPEDHDAGLKSSLENLARFAEADG
jgi:uncharacterized protein YndB with AHSA1/START domain